LKHLHETENKTSPVFGIVLFIFRQLPDAKLFLNTTSIIVENYRQWAAAAIVLVWYVS